ncbi:MAG TPA: GTPase HflX, partial [Actinomycetota bacterium]|nr:GTPase HflX [Actinomycetota bacterium]
HPEALFCSAASGEGIGDLLGRLDDELARMKVEVEVEIPFDRGELVARIHDEGDVLKESFSERGTHLVARVRRNMAADLGPFVRRGA